MTHRLFSVGNAVRILATLPKFATVAVLLAAPACVTSPALPTEGVQGDYRSAISSETCPNEDADTAAARASIAQVRAIAGLPALRCDEKASIAATRHCDYIVANKELTHEETPGRPAFFAATFDQRLAKEAFGEHANAEVLTSLTGAPAIDDWRGLVNSVYHRAPFLRAENTSFGYGHGDNCATIDFGHAATKIARVLVVWPPNGSTNVPPAFRADHETPNPLPGSTTIGSPVSLLGGDPSLGLDAHMTGPNGAEIEIALRTAADDAAHLVRKGEIHVMPIAALVENTSYSVHFVGVSPDGTNALDVTTTFTTGATN